MLFLRVEIEEVTFTLLNNYVLGNYQNCAMVIKGEVLRKVP